jgi:hypothetical protein
MSTARLRLALCAGLATLLAAACAPAPPAPSPVQIVHAPSPPPETEPLPPPPPAERVSDAERLLYYYEYALALPPEQLARERERTHRFFDEHRSEFALLQLVLLRSLPSTPAKDRTQALEELGGYLEETRERPTELRPFALMLNTLLSEQQRQDGELQAAAQKLKDEGRRNDELKQKLDALVETERKMLERNKSTRNQ